MSQFAIEFEDVQAAAERLKGIAHRTPVLTSRTINRKAGCQVFFKCENLQRGGSFKFRGAYNTLVQLSDTEKKRGVVAYSSGNHAQGVAYSAKLLGIPATIAMPTDAPKAKLEATRDYGADILRYDRLNQERADIALEFARENAATLIPPFDHPHIMAGQGTAGLELMEQVPDLDALLTPVGGGGLLSGCSIAAKQHNPDIRIYGVETMASNDWERSFRAGHPVKIPPPDTIADGMRTQQPGELTFPLIHSLADDILLVSENEVIETLKLILLRMKILAEPTGCVAPAAILFQRVQPPAKKVGVVISGGNIDPSLLARLLK